MSSPIDDSPASGGEGRPRRTGPALWSAVACAALIAASGCSSREDWIATITRDAGVPNDGHEECVPTGHEAADMGLDLYFVLERSWGNTQASFPGGSEWGLLSVALGTLFSSNNGDFVGMGAGFATYPKTLPQPQSCVESCGPVPLCNCLDDCGCWDTNRGPQGCTCGQWPPSCDDADFAPSFPIARASESENGFLLATSQTNSEPVSFADEMPLLPALTASLRYRNEWERQNPGRRLTQVLIAHSLQVDCQQDDRDLDEVEAVLSGPDKPKTYVVRVNDDSDDFDELAAAGRTGSAMELNIRTRPPTTVPTIPLTELIQKIRAIEGRCEYLLPPSATDSSKINLTASSGGLGFPKVANRAACAIDDQGWYFDTDENPDGGSGRPRRIIACEGACRRLHGGGQDGSFTSGAARIQVGCPTVQSRDAGR